MPDDVKLRECPFCGELEYSCGSEVVGQEWGCWCPNCGARADKAWGLWQKRDAATEALERVARALCDTEGFDPEQISNSTNLPLWRNYLHLARAAINALKGERK